MSIKKPVPHETGIDKVGMACHSLSLLEDDLKPQWIHDVLYPRFSRNQSPMGRTVQKEQYGFLWQNENTTDTKEYVGWRKLWIALSQIPCELHCSVKKILYDFISIQSTFDVLGLLRGAQ